MTAPAVRTLRRRFSVGRYFATLSLSLVAGKPCGIEVEWDARPSKLRPRDWAEYRIKRNSILQAVASEIGGRVLVVEPDGADGWTLTPLGSANDD